MFLYFLIIIPEGGYYNKWGNKIVRNKKDLRVGLELKIIYLNSCQQLWKCRLPSLYSVLRLNPLLFYVMPVCSLNGFLNTSDLIGKGWTMLGHFVLTSPVQTRFQALSPVLRSLNPDTSDLSWEFFPLPSRNVSGALALTLSTELRVRQWKRIVEVKPL